MCGTFAVTTPGLWELPVFLDLEQATGQPVLVAFEGGSAGRRGEGREDAEQVGLAMQRLRRCFGADVPEPTHVARTRWASDPWARGVYCHVRPGGSLADCATLAEPVGDRLRFAGEATHLKLWLNAAAPLSFEAVVDDEGNTSIGIDLGDFDPFVLEVEENTGFFEGNDAGVVELFEGTLLPMLFDQVADLGLSIPSIDLSSIDPSIPEGTALTPDITDFGRSGAYLTAAGKLK